MSEQPRYSREDYADEVAELVRWAGSLEAKRRPRLGTVLRAAAAMLSEAANRAPTHNELVEMNDNQGEETDDHQR